MTRSEGAVLLMCLLAIVLLAGLALQATLLELVHSIHLT
jgi:hypothetical protein